MIVGVLHFVTRRPGQAFGLPNHYTMIVGVLHFVTRRPGQAFGLPNHYTTTEDSLLLRATNPLSFCEQQICSVFLKPS